MADNWVHIRIDPELKSKIQEKVDNKEYGDMTAFVIEAIQEKIDPGKMEEIEEERLLKLLEKPHIQERVRKLLQPAR
jgi:Arc/MetJ-type ribon-helix-helix transcriptional regulator